MPAGVLEERPGGLPAPAATARRGRRRATLGRLGLLALFVAGLALGLPSGFGPFWFVPYAGVGSLLIVRRPGTSIGPILLGIGWALVFATLTLDVTAAMYTDGTLGPLDAVLSVITSSAGMTGFFLFAVLAIVFPAGRLPSGRGRLVARIAIAIGLLCLLASLVMPTITVSVWGASVGQPVPNPAAVMPELGIWRVITPETVVLPLAAFMVGAVISLLARYRGSRGIERQQLKWLASALAFVVIAVVGGFLLGILSPDLADSGLVWLGAVVAFPLVPIAIGVAVLRYRLYEIDRIVSRTMGWLVLTIVLAVVFAGLVVGLQALLAPVIATSTLAVAASTLAAAALFQPLRGRVQTAVDRRFNRSRYDAERIVAGLAERLRDEIDLADIGRDVGAAVGLAVQPVTMSVWLRGPAGSVASAAPMHDGSPVRTGER